jgi:hypothetical protein
MKTFIKALLAASMLMPIAAQAQETADRERGPGRRGGGEWSERASRGAPLSAEVGVDAQIRAERPQWRGNGEGRERPQWRQDRPDRLDRPDRSPWQGARPDQPQVQPQPPRPEVRQGIGDERRPDWRRPDRADAGVERRPDWQNQDRQARPPAPGNDDRRGWNARQGDQRGQWDQRRDGDRQQRDWNRAQAERRGFDERYRAQGAWNRGSDRGWADRGRYDRRDTWNRSWRNDGRYDWSRYRAANRGAYRLPRYYAPSGWGYGYRRFGIGVSLAPVLFAQSYWIDDPFVYRLPEAYGPYRWVRYYDDALLVDIRTGQVVDTVYDIFV